LFDPAERHLFEYLYFKKPMIVKAVFRFEDYARVKYRHRNILNTNEKFMKKGQIA